MSKKRPSRFQKIIIIGSLFLLFGATFFGTIHLGVQETPTGKWYSWDIQTTQADLVIPSSGSVTDAVIYPEKQQVSLLGKGFSTPGEHIHPYSLFFTEGGNIVPLVFNSETEMYSIQGTEQSFSTKQELFNYLFQLFPNAGKDGNQRVFGEATFEGMSEDMVSALSDAERQIQEIIGKSSGRVYVERPYFGESSIEKNEIIESQKTQAATVEVQKTKNPPVASGTTGSVAATSTTSTPPKKDTCPNGDYSGNAFDGKCGTKPKDACANGDYSGNFYDGKCGTKPKDACANGDYSGNLYDGKCGTKPKDSCPNGDYSGNLYDGKCGTKPKDSCPNGDYTSSAYDGLCGTKPKDVCPNGDYTSSVYDGLCGTRPKDSCPNGDCTSSVYDGLCGTRPKDSCPNGDYTSSLYDGKCGVKPDTNTRAS